jgi:4-amino-4-deoxy-L-arabinose transferase-like glycosyltransferase
VVVAIAIGLQLGGFPLLDADEGRNAEVAREMEATNDYVMPRLDGLPYLDKPIVYFAAEAALMEFLGPTELAARLPAYLFTLATAAVLFFFARREWGAEVDRRRLGGWDGGVSPPSASGGTPLVQPARTPAVHQANIPWIAAVVFLSMPLTIAFARTVIFDSALTFFVVLALAAFYFAIEESQRRWSVLAWASMGLAMITKGPVTFVLVLFVVIPYAWKRKNLGVVFPLLGIVAFAAVIAPWVWGVSKVVPEFLNYVLVTETAARMATKALKRTGPPWYFIPYLLAGALPWSLVAIFSWKSIWQSGKKRDPAMLFLILAITVPFVFFSISQSKRPQYILPLMAPLALVVARIWDEARTRAAAIVLAVFGVLLLVAPLAFHRTKMKPEIAAVADETALALGVACALGGAIALFARRRDLLVVALSVPMVVLPLAANPLMRALGERRSAKSFVAELAPHVTPETDVIGVEAFTGSMAFYLRRPIIVVTEDASELTSNYLVRRYEKFTTNPASPLKPLPYFERSLAFTTPRVYIVRNDDAKRRTLLEARGWRVVADGAHHVGYAR